LPPNLRKRSFSITFALTIWLGQAVTGNAQCSINGTPGNLCRNEITHSLDSFFRLNGLAPKAGNYSIYSFNGNIGHGYVGAFSLIGGRAIKADWPAGRWCFRYTAPCGSSDTLSVILKAEPHVKATLKNNLRFCSANDTFPLEKLVDTSEPAGGTWKWIGQTSGHLLLLPRNSDSIWSGNRALIGIYSTPLGCIDTAYTLYKIRNMPEVKITSVDDDKICENDSIKLSGTVNAAAGLFWNTYSFSDGRFTQANNASTIYHHGSKDLAGQFIHIVLSNIPLSDDVCPVAVDSVKVQISAFPVPGMGDSIRICESGVGSIVGFEKSKIPGAHLKYLWRCNPGGIIDSGIFFTRQFFKQGKYDLNLTVTNIKTSCASTITKKEWIWALPIPKADFGLKNSDIAMVYNPKFYFENKSSIDKSYFKNAKIDYEWIFQNWRFKETRKEPSPIYVSPADTGFISVTLVATGMAGCFDTAMGQVYVADNPWALMPTAFSPDEEGPRPNNHYMVQMGYAKDVKLSIFNKWGEKLFYTEDISRGWDGKYKGHECPLGVYIAVAEVKDLIGYRRVFSQSFHLLR
jgi:gliding motility-associated-like protein